MNKMTLNLGPQHPSTHGVLRLILELDGERVISCEPDIGYLHRGMEKIAESRSYIQYLPMVDRVDYLCGFFYSYAFCNAVEHLNHIEVPKYANYIRVMMMELNRIASHLLWLGTYLLDLGAISPMFYTFRERESILDYFEKITGQRMMYNYFVFGGVRHNILYFEDVLNIVNNILFKINEYENLITDNPIFLSRTRNIGVISKSKALDWGLTGPNLRASGILNDYRMNMEIYDDIEYDIILGNVGDCYSRYIVRIYEMRESVCIIKQCIDWLKSNNTFSEPVKISLNEFQKGEIYSFVEAPRGLTLCYLNSVGESTPYRLKWRTGSFYSTQILRDILRGVSLPDIMAIYGSLDVVLPEVDR